MRRLPTSVALTIALFLAQLLLISSTSTAQELDQSNLARADAGTAIGPAERLAQVITAGKTGFLDSIDFSVRKFPAFVGQIRVEIRGVSFGKPNATVIAFKTFSNALISTVPAEFTTFDLRSLNLLLSTGDIFAVAFLNEGVVGVLPIALSPDTYPGGGVFASVDGGSTWFPFVGRDARFRTLIEVPVKLVAIDIKPGSDPNSINLRSRRVIPVAILSTANFDAPNDLMIPLLTFGRTGNESSLSRCGQGGEDVNEDGLADLVCHFFTNLTGFQAEDTEGILKGETIGGAPIQGSDSVRIVGR